MADNDIEIERLRKEIQRANSEISQLERDYERKLNQEITRIKSEFAQSTAMQQKDFTVRFKQLEKSLCDAYLFEIEKVRDNYEALVDQVNSYESQLESIIQQIVQENSSILKHKAAKNAKVQILAQQSLDNLNKKIQITSQLPVNLFYPRALQRYIDAGKEAERLLQMELYSLALAKSDCASLSVDRLTDDTESKVRELESMFALYSAKYAAIKDFLSTSDSRRLIEDNKVMLELSETDLDYWSDLLYSDLLNVLNKHQDIINGGVRGWLMICQNSNISPSLQLDKEMQKLDSIPKKLSMCISYSLSACDCFNYLGQIKLIADKILIGQNYSIKSVMYGKVKSGNDLSTGYKYYYDNWLINEQCMDTSQKPDYREERIISYEKRYADGKVDQCKLYVVPIRNNDTVSFDVYLQFDTDYLPSIISQNIRNLFLESGLNVKLLVKNEKIPIQMDRPISLEVLDKLFSEESLSTCILGLT